MLPLRLRFPYHLRGVVVACLWRSDFGLWGALRYGGMAFVAVGALYAVWRLFVFLIVKREVTRNEAGYK